MSPRPMPSPGSTATAADLVWSVVPQTPDPPGRFASGPVVAGVHGTDKDEPVLAFAAAEAARTGKPLHLLHARDPGTENLATLGTPNATPPAGEPGQRFLSAARAAVMRAYPVLPVEVDMPWATPVQALCQASATASLVVVGTDRRGPLRKAVLGSTTLATAMHAHCPVAVVPEDHDLQVTGPVVVAVDGSQDSLSAVAFGLEAARAREAELVLLAVWHLEFIDGSVVTTPATPAWERVENRHAALAQSVLDSLPPASSAGVPVRIEVAHGPYVSTIIDRSEGAELLVIGSRGRGGIRGMLLGSVSHGVLQRAHIPVLVVRAHW